MSIELNDQQVYAIYQLENWWSDSTKLRFEISGRAGTGKTTLIRYFIERIGLDMKDVVFMAFMGKAALQMARNGLPGRTIHSFIYRYEKVHELDKHGRRVKDKRGKDKMKGVFKLKKKHELEFIPKLFVVDEGGMVSESIGKDLESFGIPIVVLGDLNQLPPVFGASYFMKEPDVELTKIMRQAEDDPIVWLANQILEGKRLQCGMYGNSAVISRDDLNEFTFNQADVVLTATNRLRYEVNNLFRYEIKRIKKPEMPEVGEKIICRKNNWDRNLDDIIYLTNGLSGYVEYVDVESLRNGAFKIDFRPDFVKHKTFKNLLIDYDTLYSPPGGNINELVPGKLKTNKFEFAYAITVHLSQGSQYPNVLFLDEKMSSPDFTKKLEYTAITRAQKSIVIAI